MDRIGMRAAEIGSVEQQPAGYQYDITIYLFLISGGLGCGVGACHRQVQGGLICIKKIYGEYIIATISAAPEG
jgi:hypothetical protein